MYDVVRSERITAMLRYTLYEPARCVGCAVPSAESQCRLRVGVWRPNNALRVSLDRVDSVEHPFKF